jgi:hypothetical protein
MWCENAYGWMWVHALKVRLVRSKFVDCDTRLLSRLFDSKNMIFNRIKITINQNETAVYMGTFFFLFLFLSSHKILIDQNR